MQQITSKYSDWTRGNVEALINIVGEENAKALLAGNISVKFEKVVRKLFDKHGRRIPDSLSANVCSANQNFRLDQPKMKAEVDYANRITRLHGCLDIDTKITAKQLKMETERLLGLIWGNSQITNITNGVWLPVILPQLTADDLGIALEQYLEAVDKSYAKDFDDRKFYNYRKGILANEVNIVDGSRHDQLISRMKQGPVMGIHFPNSLQGFSINASREQMSTLPEGLVLSGMDTPIAMAMYPDILARDFNTPDLDLSALSWQSADSLFFKAYDAHLDFDYTVNVAPAYDYYSGGLLFFG